MDKLVRVEEVVIEPNLSSVVFDQLVVDATWVEVFQGTDTFSAN